MNLLKQRVGLFKKLQDDLEKAQLFCEKRLMRKAFIMLKIACYME